MAYDMFCFIYIGHGFGKGHGFLHGTDVQVSFENNVFLLSVVSEDLEFLAEVRLG
jgi:hypothetical protein